MYVDILSSALDDWVTDLSGPELIEYAALCRDELRAVAPPHARITGSAYTALAAEIAYDRALIAICTEHGIYAHATTFAFPREERQRIESLLAAAGIDLDSPLWRQGADSEPPGLYPDNAHATRPGINVEIVDRDATGPTPKRFTAKSVSAVATDTSEVSPLVDSPDSDE